MAEDGFLSRWSRRKQSVREGQPVEAEPVAPAPSAAPVLVATAQAAAAEPEVQAQKPAEPPPTLEEAQQLTPESDFRRFVAPDAPPDVRNAALNMCKSSSLRLSAAWAAPLWAA